MSDEKSRQNNDDRETISSRPDMTFDEKRDRKPNQNRSSPVILISQVQPANIIVYHLLLRRPCL